MLNGEEMGTQDIVWNITLIAIALIAVTFLYVVVRSGVPAEYKDVQKRAYGIRRWFFWALVLLGIGTAYATLAEFPIPDQRGQSAGAAGAQVVNVVGKQWYWELSANRFTAGVPVEFRVTANDVNHGFGIYDPNNRLVAQTQAMPGFTNRLVHTFTEPGKYRVLCLEYCGLVHHNMITEFEVIGAPQGAKS
jgi:cytochrome c oxidase subunit 2